MQRTLHHLLPLLCLTAALPAHASQWRVTPGFQERTRLLDLLDELDATDTVIDAAASNGAGHWIVIADGVVEASAGFPATVKNGAISAIAQGHDVQAAACNANGACAVVHSGGLVSSGVLPAGFSARVNSYLFAGRTIQDIALTNTGHVVVATDGTAGWQGIPSELSSALSDRHLADRRVTDVEIGADGRWVLVSGRNPMMSEGVSTTLRARLRNVAAEGHTLDVVWMGPGDNYVIYGGDDGKHTEGTDLLDRIEHGLESAALNAGATPPASGPNYQTDGDASGLSGGVGWRYFAVNVPANASVLTAELSGSLNVDLFVRRGAQPTPLSYTCRGTSTLQTERCEIESPEPGLWYVAVRGTGAYQNVSLDTQIRQNLWERMKDYGAAGLSVAVFEDNEVIAARGYGDRELDVAPMYGSTPVDLASMSKYVGALATMAVVDDGLLDLDDELNASVPGGQVETWIAHAQNGRWAFANAAATPLGNVQNGTTLLRLLTHRGGMGSGLASPDVTMNCASDAIPLADWMAGRRCDSATTTSSGRRAWQSSWPGFGPAYSNDGFVAVQAMVEDATSMRGADAIEHYLLDPIGLSDTHPRIDTPGALAATFSKQHRSGAAGPSLNTTQMRWPWTFAGGIHTSAADFAELLIPATHEGVASNGATVLSPAATLQLVGGAPGTDAYGFGSRHPVVADPTSFYFGGRHQGATRNLFCAIPGSGSGIVVLINTDEGDSSAANAPDPLIRSNDEMAALAGEIIDAWQRENGTSETCY